MLEHEYLLMYSKFIISLFVIKIAFSIRKIHLGGERKIHFGYYPSDFTYYGWYGVKTFKLTPTGTVHA